MIFICIMQNFECPTTYTVVSKVLQNQSRKRAPVGNFLPCILFASELLCSHLKKALLAVEDSLLPGAAQQRDHPVPERLKAAQESQKQGGGGRGENHQEYPVQVRQAHPFDSLQQSLSKGHAHQIM